ncbi:MAG: IclR family transcriptional regulator [Desulfobacterales bacterium]|nr:MAG: IclR family transcriptional regulator [Desulfobacterales bacterium]
MPANKEKYYQIASLEKGMRVLELLSAQNDLTVSSVAAQLGFNRAASHRFLATLRDLGYVEKNENHRYHLTFKVLELGMKVANRFEIRTTAHSYMQELSRAFNETVNLGYWKEQKVFHLDKIDSPEILRIDTPLGSWAPAYCTALGKSILAYLPQDELETYLKSVRLVSHGPYTITSKKKLRQELIKILQQGYAVDDEELSPGLRCVAAPVFDHTGHVRYALSVSAPSSRMTQETIERVQQKIRDVCQRLSAKLR